MDYRIASINILSRSNISVLDSNAIVDLEKFRLALMEICPGKYRLEWATGTQLGMFDTVDMDKIQFVFETDDDRIEWMLKYG